MTDSPLFRQASIDAQRVNWMGNVVLARPVSFSFLTAGATLFAAALLCFFLLGSYTKRSTVAGQLSPDTGLIKVLATQPGTVQQKRVTEGQPVRRGDILYILSGDHQGGDRKNTQAEISRQVGLRRQSLSDEIDKGRAAQRSERDFLTNKISGLDTELTNLREQASGQELRVRLAQDTLSRYAGLLAQDYISQEQVLQKKAELLEQQNRLQSLKRDQISLRRELAAQRHELAGLALRQQNQLAQLQRSLSSTGQELTESEARREFVITAPMDGTATAVLAEVGQIVDGNRALLSIVPTGATLQAVLLAPSKAIGFIKPGDPVLLRYQAFPYQKFGLATGTVASVSRTALAGNELTDSAGAQGGEPLYRIIARLNRQSVTAYGQPQPLQAGMVLEADIVQEKRRLFEWVLDPLYSMTGRL